MAFYIDGDPIVETDVTETSSGSGDSGKGVKLSSKGRLDPTLVHVETMTAGETIAGATTPVAVYMYNSDDEFYACDANDQSKLEFSGFGISDGTDGNNIEVQFDGVVGGFSGLTKGAECYVQDDKTIGHTVGTYEVFVGIAISTTEILILKRGEQYIGSQSLANGGNTITSALQNVWRKIIVSGSGNTGSNTGEVSIYRFGKISGSHIVYFGSSPSFSVGFTASVSGTTLTMSPVGNSTAATGTAYYFR